MVILWGKYCFKLPEGQNQWLKHVVVHNVHIFYKQEKFSYSPDTIRLLM